MKKEQFKIIHDGISDALKVAMADPALAAMDPGEVFLAAITVVTYSMGICGIDPRRALTAALINADGDAAASLGKGVLAQRVGQ